MKIFKSGYYHVVHVGARLQKFFDFLTGWPVGFFVVIFIFSILFEISVVKIMEFFDYKITDPHQYVGIGVFGFSFFIIIMLFAGVCEERKEKLNNSNFLIK